MPSKFKFALVTPLVLLFYSGSVKWIPIWPTDPTALSFVFVIIVFSAQLLLKPIPSKQWLFASISLLLFFCFYGFTATYTASEDYWKTKALALILVFVAFIAPPVLIRERRVLQYVKNTFFMVGTAVSLLILLSYITGTTERLIDRDLFDSSGKTPDYLALGMIVSVSTILSLERNGLVREINLLANLLALVVLTGRGPLLAILVVLAMVGLRRIKRKLRRRHIKSLVFTAASIFSLVFVLMFTDLGVVTINRFIGIVTSTESYAAAFRTNDLVASMSIISNYPITGVGLGGYGEAAFQDDTNYYPHNLFIEAWVEAGIAGVVFIIGFVMCALRRAWQIRRDKDLKIFGLLALVYLLNYMKSGGFVGARDLFMVLGFLYISFPAPLTPLSPYGRAGKPSSATR